jgi:hypothetical protein
MLKVSFGCKSNKRSWTKRPSFQFLFDRRKDNDYGKVNEHALNNDNYRLSEEYSGYADALNDRWPRTAAMLRRITDVYVSEARRENVEAKLREDLWR